MVSGEIVQALWMFALCPPKRAVMTFGSDRSNGLFGICKSMVSGDRRLSVSFVGMTRWRKLHIHKASIAGVVHPR